MLAEVRLIVASKEARLVFRHGETVIEDEVWTFPRPISRTEARELAAAAFHDGYDLIQYATHGDGDS